ncbi:hypothetical protein AB0J52_07750 [Spirillospora sp. NPDC049652]
MGARAGRRGRAPDTGASGLEYAALIGVAAVIVGLFATLTGSVAGPSITAAVCRMFGGDCQPPDKARNDADYRPDKCLAKQAEEKGGYVIKIAFFKMGEEWGFLRQEFSDGTVRLTLTDTASVGVDATPKKLSATWDTGKIGDLDGKGKREVKLGGSLKFGYGDTWTFKNAAEEKKFQDAIMQQWAQQQAIQHSENPGATGFGLWLSNQITGDADVRNPNITFGKVGLEGGASGAFKSVGTNGSAEVNTGNISLEGKITPEVIVSNNKDNGERQYTYQWTGEGTGSAQALGIGEELKGGVTGAVRITRDKNGKLSRIEFINTYEYQVSSKDGLGGKTGGGNSGSGEIKQGEKRVRTTTTVLDVNDGNRPVAESWLSNNAGNFLQGLGSAVPRAMTPYAVTQDPGPGGSAFDRLLYDQAKVSAINYNNVQDAYKFGAEINLGRSFGFEATYQKNLQNVLGAQYLGAPRDGVRQYVPWPECSGG